MKSPLREGPGARGVRTKSRIRKSGRRWRRSSVRRRVAITDQREPDHAEGPRVAPAPQTAVSRASGCEDPGHQVLGRAARILRGPIGGAAAHALPDRGGGAQSAPPVEGPTRGCRCAPTLRGGRTPSPQDRVLGPRREQETPSGREIRRLIQRWPDTCAPVHAVEFRQQRWRPGCPSSPAQTDVGSDTKSPPGTPPASLRARSHGVLHAWT